VRERLDRLLTEQKRQTRLLVLLGLLLAGIAALQLFAFWRA